MCEIIGERVQVIRSFNRLPYRVSDRTLRVVQVFIFFLTLLVFSTGCHVFTPESKWQRFEYVESEMGVNFKLKFYASSEARAERVAKSVYSRVEELNYIFSDYEPDSELSRLSRAPVGVPVKVSGELFEVLLIAHKLSQQTRGAFDVTAGASVRLWRELRREREKNPDKVLSLDQLRSAQKRVGFNQLKLNNNNKTVTLTAPDLQLDLGGIAKGYAVDEAMQILKRKGINRAFVAASGDILVSRAPLGRSGWKIEIRDVDEFGNIYPRTIYLNNSALSTSGDTEQFVEINGTVFSHIVDPRNGIGLTNRIQVSVISASSTLSDCYATAICVLGKEEGLQFAETRKLQVLIMELAEGVPRVTPSRYWKGW